MIDFFIQNEHISESCCQGMSAYLKDYVVNKKIPIPELLCAFDIMLVRSELLVI